MVFNPLQQAIFTCLFESSTTLFEFTIQEGFYNPTQMATELQNKFIIFSGNFGEELLKDTSLTEIFKN